MQLHRTLAAGAWLACHLCAHADQITFTFTGHVPDFSEPGVVVDHTGIFGTPARRPAGEAYTAVIRFYDMRATNVPEPGSWTVMLAGLSSLAAVVGRRRRAP